MKIYNNKKGFTLLELLVTVVLVAILASYGVYYYTDIMDEGRENAAKGRLMALGSATARFIMENGTPDENYPVEIDPAQINGQCDTSTIMGVFNCGYAERSLSSSADFVFSFGNNPCGAVLTDITVFMVPTQEAGHDTYPACTYYNPRTDMAIEVEGE